MEIVAVRLKNTKYFYYVFENEILCKKNDLVIVESDNGLQLAKVVKEKYNEKEENLDLPLYRIIRLATKEDIDIFNSNTLENNDILIEARKLVKSLNLNMNFIECYYNLDKTQLILSFLADARVDFRELAKKLAQKYKTRIELRQIGVRDKAKKIGGIGPCGLFLCCNSFLTDFNSVSINMAKNQMLALNPSKINGVCGRLLCCLDYENEVYSDLKKGIPKVGMIADTRDGMGKVISVDVLKQTYKVDLKEKGIIEYKKDENGKDK